MESAIRGSGAFEHIGFDQIQSQVRHLRRRRESPAAQVVASSVEFIRMLFARVEQGSTPFVLYLKLGSNRPNDNQSLAQDRMWGSRELCTFWTVSGASRRS